MQKIDLNENNRNLIFLITLKTQFSIFTICGNKNSVTFVSWFFHNSIRFKVNKVNYGMSGDIL